MENKSIKQNHGLTHEEMADLRIRQMQDEVEMVPANNAGENINDKIFKEEYADFEIPKHETHLWHVATESRLFNQTSGERLSSSTVKTYTPVAYKFNKENHGFDGMTIHVLHNPELESGSEQDQSEDLSKLNVEKLKAKYKELTGNDAPKGAKKAELIELIEDSKPTE